MSKKKIDTAITELPDTVKILHTEFAMVEMDLSDYISDPCMGNISFQNKRMSYLGTDDSEMVDTIIHEINHGIYKNMGMHIADNKDEEYIVSTFATGLTTVMKDNLQLFKALINILERE